MAAAYVERRWKSPDGLDLFARDYAPGPGPARPPVIAIHGLTRNSADFEAIAPLLAQSGRRVLAVDVRGRGLSDRAPDPMTYRPDVYAADVLALMDQAAVGRAVFMGTSMGGLITMALTALRPKAVVAAILNDIGPEVAPEGLSRIAAYSGQPVEIDSWADAAAYAKRINAVAFPHYSDADWDAFARRIFRQGPDGEIGLDYDPDISVPIRAAGAKALVPNLWPMFRRLARNRPTLLVRGGVSDLLSADIAARMRKAAPDMAYVEVPQIGHAPMLDEPEAKAAIFEFLAELD
ncbi:MULTISPECIES: alpha/beta fold hydrolase [Brevundimonas]|jgi:pimeloyl-ACP methyl ester carboxylesterase|uniref:alpha/beta fold hydrolase n=1 Tax=Brevundimonas TaxID=41275 RepID=UPI0006D247D9|nr:MULTISPECIES: alpha/beta hydrolase [unclassified Brevundimonas]ALJ07544.1 alpha/beta hydrolase [Brevundimonas sp. DS20]MAL58287.1 alpha/beta hydrolase [Brevundimonas sp.]MBJ7510920.1 alpha/beta fold hydrolase [Brevundimonas sp.]